MDVVFEINEESWNYIFYLLNNDKLCSYNYFIIIATKLHKMEKQQSRKHQFNL